MSALVKPFSFAMCLALALLMENSAVSAEEKKPESNRRTVKTPIWSNSICVPTTAN
jgi:hypothetical protein